MAGEMFDYPRALAAFQRRDYSAVLSLALLHADRGEPEAQCMVALLFQCGYGVAQDAVEAERWLRRAAAQGSALAWHNLATLYSLGLPGVASDAEKARECFRRAQELGFDCFAVYPPPGAALPPR